MGRGGAPAREISFVSLMVYGPKFSDLALAMGITDSEIRQGGFQHLFLYILNNNHVRQALFPFFRG